MLILAYYTQGICVTSQVGRQKNADVPNVEFSYHQYIIYRTQIVSLFMGNDPSIDQSDNGGIDCINIAHFPVWVCGRLFEVRLCFGLSPSLCLSLPLRLGLVFGLLLASSEPFSPACLWAVPLPMLWSPLCNCSSQALYGGTPVGDISLREVVLKRDSERGGVSRRRTMIKQVGAPRSLMKNETFFFLQGSVQTGTLHIPEHILAAQCTPSPNVSS